MNNTTETFHDALCQSFGKAFFRATSVDIFDYENVDSINATHNRFLVWAGVSLETDMCFCEDLPHPARLELMHELPSPRKLHSMYDDVQSAAAYCNPESDRISNAESIERAITRLHLSRGVVSEFLSVHYRDLMQDWWVTHNFNLLNRQERLQRC